MRWPTRQELIFALVGIILVSFLDWGIDYQINHYQYENSTEYKNNALFGGAVFLGLRDGFACLWTWLHDNDKPILAAFTIGIFVVTALLARYTKKLWGSTSGLVKSARDADAPFILPEHIIGRDFYPDQGAAKNRPKIIYGFKNHGKTPAIIRRWRDYSRFTDALPDRPEFEEPWDVRREEFIPIGAGEISSTHLTAGVPLGMSAQEVLTGLGVNGQWLYIIGEVEYEDIFNTVRVQGYCLRIRNVEQVQENGRTIERVRFWRHGGSAYNYRREQTPQNRPS